MKTGLIDDPGLDIEKNILCNEFKVTGFKEF
jgi:hypothetical protein